MKLAVLNVPFANLSLEDTLLYLSSLKTVEAVELGTGGFTNDIHCKVNDLLKDKSKINKFKDLFLKYDMKIASLSCHGNPVHPNKKVASEYHTIFEQTVELAKYLDVDTIVTFSGCPGDSYGGKYPNWVTCSWPPEYGELLEWQWKEVLIPYWRKAAIMAKQNNVKIAIEMHPGFCVYNTETMLKLRKETDDVIGANFDPSHLFWQGINPVESIRALGKAIHYVHAKDCMISYSNVAVNGVLDTKKFSNEVERSWLFRTVGYGNNEKVWKDIISMLRLVSYDGFISIEHEDSLMSIKEGIEKAIKLMDEIIFKEEPSASWWM
jgi:sugar phosphate isomerase/epimerase